MTGRDQSKEYLRIQNSLNKKFDTLTSIVENAPKLIGAIKNLPAKFVEDLQSDFRDYRRYLNDRDYYGAGVAAGILGYKTVGLLLGGYGAVKGGIAVARLGANAVVEIANLAKSAVIPEMEIPWASRIPHPSEFPPSASPARAPKPQAPPEPMESLASPSRSGKPSGSGKPNRPSATGAPAAAETARRLHRFAKDDLIVVETVKDNSLTLSFSVESDGENVMLGIAEGNGKTGGMSLVIDTVIGEGETAVKYKPDGFSLTDEMLRRGMSSYRKAFGRDPVNLHGSLQWDNLTNFQREYVIARKAAPGAASEEWASAALRRISFGRAREALGYSVFRFDNSFEFSNVVIDGAIQKNVPTRVVVSSFKR